MEERRRNGLRKRLNSLLSAAGYADSQLDALKAELERESQELVARYAPQLDKLTATRERAVDAIQAIVGNDEDWQLAMKDEPGKTMTLRAGIISRRLSTAALEVTDEKAVLKSLRKLKLLRRFTTPREPKIDKVALKKVPAIVAKLDGVVLQQDENMIVKPVKAAKELSRVLQPFRRPLKS